MSHDVLALNLSFDDYFDVPMSDFLMAGILGISKWFRHDPYLLFLLDLFIGMQTNHYVQHTIAFPSGISGPDVRTSPLLGCMKWD